MPPTPLLTRAGRARSLALPAHAAAGPAAAGSTDARPLGRRARHRATAVAGGLAVLLAGPLTGHLSPAAGAVTGSVAGSASRSMPDLHAVASGLSAVTGSLGAVARTGGGR